MHTHPCKFEPNGCTSLVECDGELERNPDGHPETVCSAYHRSGGEVAPPTCEDCDDTRCACGEVIEAGTWICRNCEGADAH